jgi:hypothetical protein
MKRPASLSWLCGIALNFVFFLLSTLVMRVFPYRDKPEIPNSFTWLLVPGLLAGSQFDNHLLALTVMIIVNTLIYGLSVFCLLTIVHVVQKKYTAELIFSPGSVVAFAGQHFVVVVAGFHFNFAELAVARRVAGVVAQSVLAAQLVGNFIERFL